MKKIFQFLVVASVALMFSCGTAGQSADDASTKADSAAVCTAAADSCCQATCDSTATAVCADKAECCKDCKDCKDCPSCKDGKKCDGKDCACKAKKK